MYSGPISLHYSPFIIRLLVRRAFPLCHSPIQQEQCSMVLDIRSRMLYKELVRDYNIWRMFSRLDDHRISEQSTCVKMFPPLLPQLKNEINSKINVHVTNRLQLSITRNIVNFCDGYHFKYDKEKSDEYTLRQWLFVEFLSCFMRISFIRHAKTAQHQRPFHLFVLYLDCAGCRRGLGPVD